MNKTLLTKMLKLSKQGGKKLPVLENAHIRGYHDADIPGPNKYGLHATVTAVDAWATFDLGEYHPENNGQVIDDLFNVADLVKLRRLAPDEPFTVTPGGALKFGAYTIQPATTTEVTVEDFPSQPLVARRDVVKGTETPYTPVPLPGLTMDALKVVKPTMANQDVRYYLNGFLVAPGGVYSTDGHRLTRYTVDTGLKQATSEDAFSRDAIVPREALDYLDLKQQDTEFSLLTDQDSGRPFWFNYKQTDVVYSFKVIDGQYPDAESILAPIDTGTNSNGTKRAQCTVNRADMLAALRTVEPCTNDKLKGIKVIVSDDMGANACHLTFSANSGSLSAEATVKYSGYLAPTKPGGEIGVNVTYLMAAIADAPTGSDTITLDLADKDSVLAVVDNEHYTHLVMPMRL